MVPPLPPPTGTTMVQQHIPGVFTTISSVLPQGFSDTKAQRVGTNSLSAQGCTTQSPADFEQGLEQESFPGGPDGGASCAATWPSTFNSTQLSRLGRNVQEGNLSWDS